MTLQTFEFIPKADAGPMNVIMGSNTPPAERARAIARMLDEMVIGGQFERLNQSQLCRLRGIVFGMDALAEDLEHPKVTKRGWWRVWG